MTLTSDSNLKKNYPEEIITLLHDVEQNPNDLVAKISLASILEQYGYLQDALEVYQTIIVEDEEGVFRASAEKALENLQFAPTPNTTPETIDTPLISIDLTEETPPSDNLHPPLKDTLPPQKNRDIILPQTFQGLSSLPIQRKQLLGLLGTSLLCVTGVVTAGVIVRIQTGKVQLSEQANTELAISTLHYQDKISQLASGFQGQAENIAIISLTRQYNQTKKANPSLEKFVKTLLQKEIQSRHIEYATLVGKDGRIIINANQNRQNQPFNPDKILDQIFQKGQSLTTNMLIPWSEIKQENPPLPTGLGVSEQNVLIRYSFTPVKDPQNNSVIGVLIAGDMVNQKHEIPQRTVESIKGGYNAIYQKEPDGHYTLATSVLSNPAQESLTEINIPVNSTEFLNKAEKENITGTVSNEMLRGKAYTMAVQPLFSSQGKTVGFIVRGTPETRFNQLLQQSLLLEISIGLVVLVLAVMIANTLGKTLTQPIEQLRESALKIASGDMTARAEITTGDEIGELAKTFNKMADRVTESTIALEEIALQRQQEADFQRQEKEQLQEGVIRLLLDIEEASHGDLTLRSQVDEGEVGSIADAFNATLNSLQKLVKQVQLTTNEVRNSAVSNGKSMTQLSEGAIIQAQEISIAESSVKTIAESIQEVAQTAQAAAEISQKSRLLVATGQERMDDTVSSIDNIRSSVANTSKKAKRLAESAQEISKIVSIISSISEKTNLLAFNASIEAARAGEHGQGFRIVADEVRRLAEQVTFSTQDIEQLITGIQAETVEMMQMMEGSTTQVVAGTQLVYQTKQTLEEVTTISQEIDILLADISQRTVSQRADSRQVQKTMEEMAKIAQKTSSASQEVSQSLQQLVKVAIELQESASQFTV